jgi:hypothetical protein
MTYLRKRCIQKMTFPRKGLMQENNLTKKTTQPRKQLNQENNSTKKIS